MIKKPQCRVEIGRMKLAVPLYKDEDATHEIAREVEERIERIEEETEVIDTQKNAVLAAFECVVEQRALIEEHEEDIRELVRALEKLTSQLKALAKRFHLPPPPPTRDE